MVHPNLSYRAFLVGILQHKIHERFRDTLKRIMHSIVLRLSKVTALRKNRFIESDFLIPFSFINSYCPLYTLPELVISLAGPLDIQSRPNLYIFKETFIYRRTSVSSVAEPNSVTYRSEEKDQL